MGAYEIHEGQVGVRLSYIVYGKSRYQSQQPDTLKLMSYSAYEKKAQRNPEIRLRAGKGSGNETLLSYSNLSNEWKHSIKQAFGCPQDVKNPLEPHFRIDEKAALYYSGDTVDSFRFADGTYLTPDQAEKYTLNASTLNALKSLKVQRESSRKMRGSSARGLWPSLISDLVQFNDVLKKTQNSQHSLPVTNKIKAKLRKYEAEGYDALIDGRAKNNNAQKVSQSMINLWSDIYAGQRLYKPDYTEVHTKYEAFRHGLIDIINVDTGEIHDPHNPDFREASRSSVYAHQSAWENRSATHSKRSGDRQVFIGKHEVFHKFKQPQYAGSIISIDDRQPPFKTLAGHRMWFYLAIDLGSEAITTWVHGETKEGIILEFYRQMVRNYSDFGVQLPYELEGESSLNSSYTGTFLKDGAMFAKTNIIANKARSKRIEAHFRQIRYGLEKKREGWIARPHAKDETNQAAADKTPRLPKETIVGNGLEDIATWNNTLHGNQELHPGLTRWDVFMDKQHPELQPMNWPAILHGLGKSTKSTMKAGRIILQGKHRVVGHHGTVATGEALINILKKIEGQEIVVRWIDGNQGQLLKALVYDLSGHMVCELLGDLAYHRATLERTPSCKLNQELTSAYANTVTAFIARGKKAINKTAIIHKPQAPTANRFVMPGAAPKYSPKIAEAEPLPCILTDFEPPSNGNRSRKISDRF